MGEILDFFTGLNLDKARPVRNEDGPDELEAAFDEKLIREISAEYDMYVQAFFRAPEEKAKALWLLLVGGAILMDKLDEPHIEELLKKELDKLRVKWDSNRS